ncbi:hypothetical protein GPECTOR_41g726 [Gonium pectorale]|uniref:t-SNARE coiled-coil homology domain-containing protein n=1 Tax=Gonium pectorale TaxID=33097 RepID=A0A150GA89_GONPE|nr:hypothetical protein GPECTOR_41g726 [Gonium pectorale]|eukprot:KXZ46761.1 hypothetical protein GPECTOR_41g726 [Gonium pectorale]
MSATEILESLQRKLHGAASPTIARHSVAGIFATLRKPGISEDARGAAISLCLSRPQKVVAQEAAEQLLSLAASGGLRVPDAVELLLSAITTAGAATAPPLVDALVRMLLLLPTAASAPTATWSSHPLVAALLSCPAAASQLLSSAVGALGSAAAAVAAAAAAAVATPGGRAAPASASASAAAAASAALESAWGRLEPFFSFVLLQRHGAPGAAATASGSSASAASSAPASSSSAATSAVLAACLLPSLVRLAAGGPLPPPLRLRLLHFLCAHVALGPRGSEVDRMRAAQSAADVLDVLEAVLYDIEEGGAVQTPGAVHAPAADRAAAAAAAPVASALLQLAFEIMLGSGGGGGGGGAGEVVAALVRLSELVPGALNGQLAALSLLTLTAYGKELQGLHLLMHRTLRHRPPPSGAPPAASAEAAMSLQPLLAAVAFGTAAGPAAWPAHLASLLQRAMAGSSGCGGGGDATAEANTDGGGAYGDLCMARQCRHLLFSLWSAAAAAASAEDTGQGAHRTGAATTDEPVRFLASLELALRQRRRAAAAAKAAAEQLPFAVRLADSAAAAAGAGAVVEPHPAVSCLLAALLAHPDPRVRSAAAAAARQLVLLLPAAALPLLPLVMYQLQRGSAAGSAATAAGASAQLALLQVLPAMAADPGVAPYALRVLSPMLAAGAPQRLRCLGLKLLADSWLISGRGWPAVCSALTGLAPPGARDPAPALRVTRAALLRAVCDRDPGRGVELVSALQQAITDGAPPSAGLPGRRAEGCPAAAALGLEALGCLAEEDVVDFYSAFRVVHSRPPAPPLPRGASAAAAAAAAKRAAAEGREAYCGRLRDALRRLGWRGPWHARLATAAWAAFVRRWMDDTGLAAAEAAAALAAEWDGTAGGGASGGAAAVLEGVGLAAGALCLAAEGLPEADVSTLLSRLMQLAQSGRSSGISRGALLGAALAATRLHPTDWAARQQVLSELRLQLLAGPSAVVRSAAATALGALAGSVASDPAIYISTSSAAGAGDAGGGDGDGGCTREVVAVAEALAVLSSSLAALCPQLAAPLAELAASALPSGWPTPQGSGSGSGGGAFGSTSSAGAPKPLSDDVDELEVLPSTAAALASLLCDVQRAHGLPPGAMTALMAALVRVAGDADGGGGAASAGRGGKRAASAPAAAVAALEGAAALAVEALRYRQLSDADLSCLMHVVRRLVDGGGALSGDGRVRGAAAACLARVGVAALRQGVLLHAAPVLAALAPSAAKMTSPEQGQGPDAVAADAMTALVAELSDMAAAGGGGAATAQGKAQHVAAARTGAVAGLAALLLPPPPSLVEALAPLPAGAISAGGGASAGGAAAGSGPAGSGSAAAAGALAAAPELCVALASRAAALEVLPYTLPRLLARPPWSSSTDAVAGALLAVAREGQRRQSPAAVLEREGALEGEAGALRVVLACLWALRDVVPPYTYDLVHSTLGWRVLARAAGATREVEALVFKLASNVSQLRKLVDMLGTPKDTLDHRHRIADVNATIQDDYKATQRMAAEREAASLPRPAPGTGRAGGRGAGTGGDSGLTAPLLGPDGGVGSSSRGADDVEAAVRRQAQKLAEVAALDDSVRYQEALIEERDAGIAEIQRQIGEVNEMFQDLAVLIADQGEQLQTVDTAISTVAERVVEGQRQLVAASRSSRSARNKCLLFWLVAAVVVSVLLIILLT